MVRVGGEGEAVAGVLSAGRTAQGLGDGLHPHSARPSREAGDANRARRAQGVGAGLHRGRKGCEKGTGQRRGYRLKGVRGQRAASVDTGCRAKQSLSKQIFVHLPGRVFALSEQHSTFGWQATVFHCKHPPGAFHQFIAIWPQSFCCEVIDCFLHPQVRSYAELRHVDAVPAPGFGLPPAQAIELQSMHPP